MQIPSSANWESGGPSAGSGHSQNSAAPALLAAKWLQGGAELEDAQPVPVPVPAPVPASAPPQDALFGFLAQHRLQQYHAALLDLGAQMPADLNDLEEADLDSLGMKKLEKNRLHKALGSPPH